MCPRERGQAYQEVVPWRSRFLRGNAELQCLVFPRHDAYRAKFCHVLLEEEFQVLREDEKGAGHHPDYRLIFGIEAGVEAVALQLHALKSLV